MDNRWRCLVSTWGLLIWTIVGAHAAGATDPTLLFEERFDGDLSNWVVEQAAGGRVTVDQGSLDIDDANGCTIWYKYPLTAPVLIEFEATPVQAGGPNDHVRDLNCFWMAKDPRRPHNLFAHSTERGGRFANYADLRLYYVGYGGNSNTTTRFRRYPGSGETPLLPEHDLRDESVMLQPNQRHKVQLTVWDDIVRYACNGRVVFDYRDPKPLSDGWFGIRTVDNHLRVHGVRIYRLNALPETTSTQQATNVSPEAVITRAGNAESEKQRYELLSELRKRDDLPPELPQELDVILPVVDWWANGREKPNPPDRPSAAENGYLCGFFNQQARRKGLPREPRDRNVQRQGYSVVKQLRARLKGSCVGESAAGGTGETDGTDPLVDR